MYTVGDVYGNRFFLRARATRQRRNIKQCVICHFEGFPKLYKIPLYWSKKHASKKKLRYFEIFKAKKNEFGWISTGPIFWYVIAQSFLGSMVYLTRKVPTGTSHQKRVRTRATTLTNAQNKAIRKISIFKFSPNESYYIPFDVESWDESNGV